MKLTILIPTLKSRENHLKRLLDILLPQIGQWTYSEATFNYYNGTLANILILKDNKEMTVGFKRNALIKSCKTEYFSFVDDDDIVSHEYVACINRKLKSEPDVVTFWGYRYHNGKKDRRVNYDIKFDQDLNPPQEYQRLPNHLCVWKTELAEEFKDISYGEDADWAIRMKGKAIKQEKVDKILYTYLFNQHTTETQRDFFS